MNLCWETKNYGRNEFFSDSIKFNEAKNHSQLHLLFLSHMCGTNS